MKTFVQVSLVIYLPFSFHTSQAQNWEGLFERDWKGASRSRTTETSIGFFYCSECLRYVVYNSDNNTFTGYRK
ncbi:MAG: hypothetical protein ACI9O4_000048 [Chitinophagales bacterium]|jgi:hypothetical protein